MHYANGREAKNGDKVIVKPSYGTPYIGILYDAIAGNSYCNGKVVIIAPNDPGVNLKEVLHIEDADIAGVFTRALNSQDDQAPGFDNTDMRS